MKLRLYILRQLLLAFAFSVGGMLFIALPGVAVAALHKLPTTDVLLLLKYLPLVLQNLAPYVLPIGFMLAVVSTYGRLAADNEWTSLQMAGFKPLGMLLPGALFACLLGLGTYWLVANELPGLKAKEKSFIRAAMRSAVLNIQPWQESIVLGDFGLHGFRDGELFRDAYVYQRGRDTADGGTKLHADTVRLEYHEKKDTLYVIMTGIETVGDLVTLNAEYEGSGENEHTIISIPLDAIAPNTSGTYRGARYLKSAQMRAAVSTGQIYGEELSDKDRRRFLLELHYRYSIAASFLLFLGLGAPTGLLLRRGTQLGALAVAVGYALVYYLLSMRLGKELGRSEAIHPILAAWASTAGGAVVSIVLLSKALRR